MPGWPGIGSRLRLVVSRQCLDVAALQLSPPHRSKRHARPRKRNTRSNGQPFVGSRYEVPRLLIAVCGRAPHVERKDNRLFRPEAHFVGPGPQPYAPLAERPAGASDSVSSASRRQCSEVSTGNDWNRERLGPDGENQPRWSVFGPSAMRLCNLSSSVLVARLDQPTAASITTARASYGPLPAHRLPPSVATTSGRRQPPGRGENPTASSTGSR
jgi:hypothetical protein